MQSCRHQRTLYNGSAMGAQRCGGEVSPRWPNADTIPPPTPAMEAGIGFSFIAAVPYYTFLVFIGKHVDGPIHKKRNHD
jgi:hypothetical protein